MHFFLILAIIVTCTACHHNDAKTQTGTDSTNNHWSARDSIVPKAIPATQLPAGINVEGQFKEAWEWTDKNGMNVLVLSKAGPYADSTGNAMDEPGQTAELFGAHYILKNGTYENSWVLHDKEISCPFDITTDFIKGTTRVTDLDKDGIAEIKVQYALACRSDVSPAIMKLLIYEAGTKYSLQGWRWVRVSPEDHFTVTTSDVNLETTAKNKEAGNELYRFGRYETEKDFTDAPPSFLSFAKSEWLKYVKEEMGEEN